MNIRQLLTRKAWTSSGVSRDIRYRERFEFAIALSLLVHALILALRFGSAGFGLPWGEERVQAPSVTLRMSEDIRSLEPAPPAASLERDAPPAAPPASGAPSQAARAVTTLEVRIVPAPSPAPAPPAAPRRETRKAAAAAPKRARERVVKAKPAPRILAQAKPEVETFKVPAAKRTEPEPQRAPDNDAKPQAEEPRPAEQAADQARRETDDAARAEAEEAARRRAEEESRQRALAQKKEEDAKKLAEAKRLEEAAKKQEEARRQAAELEAKKLAEEKARQEVEEIARKRAIAQKKEEEEKKLEEARRIEEKKKEEAQLAELKKKEEEGRRIRIEMEALKRAEELAKLQAEAKRKEVEAKRAADEAAKAKEAQRLADEAAKAKEADRKRAEAEARERDRLATQKPGPLDPGQLSGLDIARKALEDLRNPGTPRGDLKRPPGPPTTAENPRRRSVFGIERDVQVRSYIDSWRSKLERYGTFNYRRSATRSAVYDNPIVTVAIRSDGTLEDVRIHRSSGLREIDEAVYRISELHAPYSKFPPALARQYDVIEIRRVWSFEETLKILDEM